MKYTLEVIADSVASAIVAEEGGADRIELLANFQEGGVTPSYGLIAEARKHISIDIHLMIRPRGGDFCYSDYEFQVMETDIKEAKKLAVNGVVFGILNADKTVDVTRNSRLVNLAKPLKVTFHRAFDETPDPFEALADVINIGADHLLTSGQEVEALKGASLISELVTLGKDKISIMPGAGVCSGNLIQLVQKTGALEYHSSAKPLAMRTGSIGNTTGQHSFQPDMQEVHDMKLILTNYKHG
ncbi:MAG: copper homeostasis protein CutC [Cyclobacteriaceae bacterium]|nr:MAG: copper homeostasis protein CutC [Cyclobacteriaceae bacterium]